MKQCRYTLGKNEKLFSPNWNLYFVDIIEMFPSGKLDCGNFSFKLASKDKFASLGIRTEARLGWKNLLEILAESELNYVALDEIILSIYIETLLLIKIESFEFTFDRKACYKLSLQS